MTMFSGLLGLSLLAAIGATGAASPHSSQGHGEDVLSGYAVAPEGALDGVQEILVEAPEPRYVAPTLRDRIGRIWAPVYIDGLGPFRLVLDTGASNSVITADVVERLGVPLPQTASIRVHGVTGSTLVSAITVEQIEVGDHMIQGKMLPIVADVFGGAQGVLGAEVLGGKRIFIDFMNDHIEIASSRGQRIPRGSTRIPLKITESGLLTLTLRIGSVRTLAIIDTGAQRTIGNSALRRELSRREREALQSSIVGVSLDVATGQSLPTPPISFGNATIKGLHITFGDMFIFKHWRLTEEPVLLIGMDVLGLLDTLVIDYKKRALYVRTR